MKLLMLLLLLFQGVFGAVDHALYLAVIEVDQSAETVTFKVFWDDLEDAIQYTYPNTTKLSTSFIEHNQANIEAYFKKHFSLTINKEEVLLSELLVAQKEGERYEFKFEIKAIEEWKQVTVKVDCLTEILPLQQNILQVKTEHKKYFERLSKSRVVANFIF